LYRAKTGDFRNSLRGFTQMQARSVKPVAHAFGAWINGEVGGKQLLQGRLREQLIIRPRNNPDFVAGHESQHGGQIDFYLPELVGEGVQPGVDQRSAQADMVAFAQGASLQPAEPAAQKSAAAVHY